MENTIGVKLLALILMSVIFFESCSTPKNVAYLQGVDSLTPEQLSQMNQEYTSRICQDDLLSITVTAWDPTVATPFNPPVYAYATEGEQPITPSAGMYTYLVDKEGYINFPVLGKIKVEGLSKGQLGESLQKELLPYMEKPLVNVQILNYKITLLGEINRPGSQTIRNDRVSILDAIGQAGDLTINAQRENILIVRDNGGQKEFGRIDITRPDLFTSPYYYLHQNDVVYVEPNKAKKKNSHYSQAQQYNVTVASSILSAISVITSVVITIITASK